MEHDALSDEAVMQRLVEPFEPHRETTLRACPGRRSRACVQGEPRPSTRDHAGPTDNGRAQAPAMPAHPRLKTRMHDFTHISSITVRKTFR